MDQLVNCQVNVMVVMAAVKKHFKGQNGIRFVKKAVKESCLMHHVL